MNFLKIKHSNLYEIIRSICFNEYILGIHGTYDSQSPSFRDSIQRANCIMKEGLRNTDSDLRIRNIHRTVKFLGKLDDQRDQPDIIQQLKGYKWMDGSVYLLIAIPRILRTKQNNIYLGIPNNDLIIYSENTSFLDKAIYGTVPYFFILGYYYFVDNAYINLTLNSKHVSFYNHYVSDEYFNRIKSILTESLEHFECPLLHSNMSKKELLRLKEYLKKMGYHSQEINHREIKSKYWDEIWISETIRQYFDEKNKILLPKSKFTQEQIMKILESEEDTFYLTKHF